MKRHLSLIIVLMLLFAFTSISFGEIDKLCGHWAQGEIDEQFVMKYFDYLAKDNYKDFSPNGNITVGEFTSSVGKLFCEYGFCHNGIDSDEVLTRKDMGIIIGRKLIEDNIIKKAEEETPFTDLNNFTKEEKIIISSLYKNNLIKGNSQNLFLPEKNATQAECIILLKRVKGVLEPMDKNAIPFKVKSIEQVYSGVNEGVTVREANGKVLVTVVEMYPTPGYTTNVDKIFKDSTGEYAIYLSENPPKEGSIQLQVITYKVIVLEIDATNLGEKPYTFKTANNSIYKPSINQL